MSKPFTIMTDEHDRCYICGSYRWIEWHHIFGASYRNKSTKYGLVIPLCHWHHNEPPNGAHFNTELDNHLRATAQRKAMERYGWTVDQFRKIFGKNYI